MEKERERIPTENSPMSIVIAIEIFEIYILAHTDFTLRVIHSINLSFYSNIYVFIYPLKFW